MPDMSALTLKTAIGNYGHTTPLKDGTVASEQIAMEHVEVNPVIAIFRRMIRGLEFDVSEMALSTYLCARAHDKPITAIPAFVVRGFHHGAILYNTRSGITSPSDLEGRRVGVRGYTVTTGVWVRGILSSAYGVNLDKVTWVLSGDEHVAEYQHPSNVVSAESDDLAAMLAAGDIDAAIGAGRVDSPDVKPLIPDARQAAADYMQQTGVFPINHTIVMKNEVMEANPWLPEELFRCFKAAKETYMQHLSSGQLEGADQAIAHMGQLAGGDPLPFGVEANRKTLETFVDFNIEQKVLTRKVVPEEVFAPSTLSLS
jgi:4,5-dihydroxyphthalate decarboxylase